MIDFRNESGLDFTDISSEAWREYTWDNGRVLRVVAPLRLNVSDDGGHRLFDGAGVSHYVPAGWIALSWQARDGAPHSVK